MLDDKIDVGDGEEESQADAGPSAQRRAGSEARRA